MLAVIVSLSSYLAYIIIMIINPKTCSNIGPLFNIGTFGMPTLGTPVLISQIGSSGSKIRPTQTVNPPYIDRTTTYDISKYVLGQ